MTWLGIESAPKDGTQILAYGRFAWDLDFDRPDQGRIGIAVVDWEPGVRRRAGAWRLVNDNPYDDFMDATHWMPLPPPPSEGEK